MTKTATVTATGDGIRNAALAARVDMGRRTAAGIWRAGATVAMRKAGAGGATGAPSRVRAVGAAPAAMRPATAVTAKGVGARGAGAAAWAIRAARATAGGGKWGPAAMGRGGAGPAGGGPTGTQT